MVIIGNVSVLDLKFIEARFSMVLLAAAIIPALNMLSGRH